jgi:hypothetical protein
MDVSSLSSSAVFIRGFRSAAFFTGRAGARPFARNGPGYEIHHKRVGVMDNDKMHLVVTKERKK